MKPKDHNRKPWKQKQGKEEGKYWDGYADFGDFVLKDEDVAKFVNKHIKFRDRFDIRRITEIVLYSFSMLSNNLEALEDNGNWKF